MNPRKLSYDLRKGHSPDLARRRWIIGLNVLGTAMAQIVSLYQTGIVRRLPDPPLRYFDSSRVDASEYAYSRLRSPDGFMMLVSYGFTAWLAAAGGKDRARQNPLLPIAMGVKAVVDSAVAVELAREEWRDNQAFCAYCQIATLCSFASVIFAMPEVRRAIGYLRSKPDTNVVTETIESVRELARGA
ncbi:MAG: vitamin K epoxide reductase [Chloroflexi bacterium]|nr:MAG: vitamin K epoxide reductase [Chloroflexota bacterium]